ncbi:MAG TPA: hypothetical protein VK169_01090 [Saprospiraceae bacterium]|nr:hypothetical protein [Saprospiraceae bacterium]
MKIFIAIFLFISLMTSCSLTSTTYIKPNESFVLGNNQHGKFSVKLKNISTTNLTIWLMPLDGGKHSPIDIKPNETVKVKVDKNTALTIENNHPSEASVELVVKGDTGLSMGYKSK